MRNLKKSKRGYDNKAVNGYVVALGGANLDIKGYPEKCFIPGTSNPGRIFSTPGGVARNTAASLAELQSRVYLISAVGQDFYGEMILKKTGNSGVNLEYIIKSSRYQTGTYLALLDNQGELQAAVADMEIIREIVPEKLEDMFCLLSQADYIFADTNLPVPVLEWLMAAGFEANIIVDPVSLKKAGKIKNLIGKIAYLTPNLEEFFYLYGLKEDLKLDINNKNNSNGTSGAAGKVRRIAEIVVSSRSKLTPGTKLLVSLGSAGVIYAGPEQNFYQPSPGKKGRKIIETTGAGDALTAGFIRGLQLGLDPEEAAALGQQAALLTIQSRDAVVSNLAEQLAGNKETGDFK